MFSAKAIEYYTSIRPPGFLPRGVEILNPYEAQDRITREFYNKFYADNDPRLLIFGINPGRFGGGLTGISFTDPVSLRMFCGIENDLGNRRELSSEFIYNVIGRSGGAQKFFRKCFLTALFPFALLKNGRNYNFYDDKKTFSALLPYLKENVNAQCSFGCRKDKVISLGLKNAGILAMINEELQLFDRIEVLEHPRFIMQYKRRYLGEYTEKYLSILAG